MTDIITKKRKHFSPEEDRLLFSLIQIYGTSNWKEISQFIPDRSCRQCRERYIEYLSPGLQNKPWTREEDQYLCSLFQQYGSKWAKFTQYLPGRSANNIKNRWHSHLKGMVQPPQIQKTELPRISTFLSCEPIKSDNKEAPPLIPLNAS